MTKNAPGTPAGDAKEAIFSALDAAVDNLFTSRDNARARADEAATQLNTSNDQATALRRELEQATNLARQQAIQLQENTETVKCVYASGDNFLKATRRARPGRVATHDAWQRDQAGEVRMATTNVAFPTTQYPLHEAAGRQAFSM